MYSATNNSSWLPMRTLLDALPPNCRQPCDAFLGAIVGGPGFVYKEVPSLIKKYPTEVYCAIVAANSFVLQLCFTSTSYLAFTAPVFLLIHLSALPLMYGRILIECAIAKNEPIKVDTGPYKDRNINMAWLKTGTSGSMEYKNTLSEIIRHPFSVEYSVAMLAASIAGKLFYTSYLSQNLATTLLFYSETLAMDVLLFVKLTRAITLNKKLSDLEAWVNAAPNGEKNNRQLAKKAILCYLKEESNHLDQLIKTDHIEVNFLGIQLLLRKLPDYKLSFKNLQLTSLPDIVWHLITLRELDLEGNQLTKLSEKVAHLPYLETLNVRHNQLCTLPEKLATHLNLTQLKTKGNAHLTMPEKISQQSHITTDSSNCIVQ